MKKTIFFIAIIAIALCGKTFLGDLKANYEKAKADFEAQYKAQMKLQQQIEDLSAAAAAGAVDPKAVVDTINGLTEAAKFWGGFVGNEIFNKEELAGKIEELKSKRSELQKYATTDGTQAMIELNQAIWDINVCIKSIQTLAIQLKKGGKRVMTVTKIAFKDGQEELSGKNLRLYKVAIRILTTTLKTGNENAKNIQEKLLKLQDTLNAIDVTMKAVSDHLKHTATGKSQEFNDWKNSMRAKVYGGCAAGVIFPPAAAACYAIGAPILESEIASYKRETEQFVRDFNSWAQTFTGMAEMSTQAVKVCENWYMKVTSFKTVIQDQYNAITDYGDDLLLYQDLRDMMVEDLQELMVACDKIIEDTTGRLEEVDEQALNAELPEVKDYSLEFPELTEEQVIEQVQKSCRAANPERKKQQACFEETMEKISSQF